jgi:photosystem II stability/assembly factor-like uncharacterized protein
LISGFQSLVGRSDTCNDWPSVIEHEDDELMLSRVKRHPRNSSRLSLILVCVIIPLLIAPVGEAAGAPFGTWSTGGPFGGVVRDLVFDPTDQAVVYAATRNGVFRSGDGGVSWNRRSRGLTNLLVDAVAVNPNHPEVIWAGTNGGLFKSSDEGLHWSLSALIESSAVDIAESRPSEIFTDGHRSFDGGRSWDRFTPDQVFGVAIDPVDADIVLMSSTEGTFRSVDAGETWSKVAVGDLPFATGTFVFDRVDSDIVYALNQLVYRSLDGGISFDPIPSQPAGEVYSLALSVTDSLSLYVAGRVDHDAYVARSTDGGDTWNATAPVLGATISPVIHSSDADPEHVIVGTFGHGIFTSFDGGANWSNANQGLAATTLTAIAVDPGDGRHALAVDGFSFFESSSAGNSWVDRTRLVGDPARPGSEVFPTAVGIDAAGTGIVARVSSVPNDLTFEPLLKSTDGINWTPTGDLPGGSIIDQLVGDPTVPDLFLASVRDGGFPVEAGQIYRSADGGGTWEPLGPTMLPPISFGRMGGGRLVVQVGDSAISKMFVSDDDGSSWTRVTQPPDIIEALVFDGSPQRIIAGSQQASRVFLSNDGGDHWVTAWLDRSGRSSNVTSLAIDRDDPAVVYAGTDRGGLWVSTDHGLTWSQHVEGESLFSVGALGPTLDTGLTNDAAQPLFVGVGKGRRSGAYRLIPAPRNVHKPRLVRPQGTRLLEVRRGAWKNEVRFTYLWLRDGVRLGGVDGVRYRLRSPDHGHRIVCQVRAIGPGGSRWARTTAFVWG